MKISEVMDLELPDYHTRLKKMEEEGEKAKKELK